MGYWFERTPPAARRIMAAQALGLLLLAGCVSVHDDYGGSRRPAQAGPPLTAGALLAPVEGSGGMELAALEVPRASVSARLRAAWIYCQIDQPRRGMGCVDAVLYAPEGPSPAEEAFARYIRGECYRALDDDSRAEYEFDRARELALDAELKRRLTGTATPAPAPASLAIRARKLWQPSRENRHRLEPMGKVYRLTIHHSAVYFRDTSERAAAAAIRKIQRAHVQGSEYGDIGYHLLIDPAGRVWSGRDLAWQGAHARGANNRGNVGICLLGNFVRGRDGQQPNPAQVAALRKLLEHLMREFKIPAAQIKTHREFVATLCPGERLQSVINRLRRDLQGGAAVAGH